MGKKGKAKTKAKKKVKKIAKAKGKHIGIKEASRIVKKADKEGLDLGELASSAVSSIPIVGGFASNLIDQSARIGGSSSKGGVRGVQLVDATLGNLGTISRKKALSILVNRNRRPPRRRSKTVTVLRAGESVQVV